MKRSVYLHRLLKIVLNTAFIVLVTAVNAFSQESVPQMKARAERYFAIVNNLINTRGFDNAAILINHQDSMLQCRRDFLKQQIDFIHIVDSTGVVHAQNGGNPIQVGSRFQPYHYTLPTGRNVEKDFRQYKRIAGSDRYITRNIGLYHGDRTDYGVYREWVKKIPGVTLFSRDMYAVISIRGPIRNGPSGSVTSGRVVRLNKRIVDILKRGDTYCNEGNYSKAHETYIRAVKTDKRCYGNVSPRLSICAYYTGNACDAVMHKLKEQEENSNSPYCYFLQMAFAADCKKIYYEDAKKILKIRYDYFCNNRLQDHSKWARNVWAKDIAKFFTGEISQEELIRKAGSDREKLCEAYCYSGIAEKMNDNNTRALRLFEKSIETGVTNFFEYGIAKYLVNRGR